MTSKPHESSERPESEAPPPRVEAPSTPIVAKTRTPSFPIVGIGASAGGLEAYRQLLGALPVDTGMAFVLVQHLAPEHQSMLAEILGRSTQMSVTEVTDEPRVEPNHVYVIPPNRTMLMTDGHLTLMPRSEVRGQHRSIDSFLRSLAEDSSHHAIGVILSGSGTDGTLGLEAIKAEGGVTFAQDETAGHSDMPRSAIAAGCVDFVLPPEEIARELARIGRHPYVSPVDGSAAVSVEAAAQSDLNKILQLLHDATKVDFTLYKSTTLYRRITRRMLLHRMAGLPEYLRMLQSDAGELQALHRDILISVTAFFRDPACFDTIKRMILPKLVSDRARNDPLRLWALGCSTGEEAYSLAITLTEFATEQQVELPVQIFATDLNDQGIEKARAGVYSKNIVQDVSPERLRRFFIDTDGGYQVCKAVREMCVFARQNVLADPPFSRMDLISCRNLLIYMEPILQRRLVPMLHYALKPGGYLWLGSSESIGSFTDLFEPAESKHKIFAKKPAPATSAPSVPLVAVEWTSRGAFTPPRHRPVEAAGNDAQREADRMALAKYAPPGVLVNADLEILQFRGDTSPFLAPAPGKPSINVLKMAREGLLVSLRSALQKAIKEGAEIRQEGLRVKSNGGWREVNLAVLPVRSGSGGERSFLVLFEETAEGQKRESPQPEGPLPPPAAAVSATEAERQVERLTEELAATREYMQSLIEQKEAANEEMQSANEEIQSANEELQSVNEELQTSKEEIQSSNEELNTVNDELRHRNEQLDRAHNDLNNFVASSHLAMVMVGTDLRIRRFSPAAEQLLNLIRADIGRPIEDLNLPLGTVDLAERLAEVLATVQPLEREVQDRKGQWYSLRLRPYRTMDNKIEGAVLVLVDIAEQKRALVEIRASQEKYRLLVEGARGVALMLLDAEGRVSSWNIGAERLFDYTEHEIVGEHFSRFFTQEDVAAGRPERELDEARIDLEVDYETWLKRKDGTRFWASGATSAVRDDAGQLTGFSKIVRDTTERKRSEEALRESQARLRAALAAARMGTWLWYFDEDRFLADESLHRMLRLPPKAIRGIADFLDIVYPEDRAAVREAFERCARHGSDLDVEFRVPQTDGGVLWFRERGKVIPREGGTPGCLTGACVDVTELKEAEETLREADRRKNEFLATLAHELRNPLAPLSNILVVLRQVGSDTSTFEQSREVMERQVRKLARLVDDLLDVARIGRGKIELRREAVDLTSLVPQAIESVRHHISAAVHELSVALPPEPVWVDGDPIRLEQVVANLLHNAAKYTDAGGQITLSLQVAEREDASPGAEAVLSVRDSGIGLAPEMLPQIFDFFVRADVSYSRHSSGLGIGLSLVKTLVELHGGRVEARSDGLGKGSEFVVRLPLRPVAEGKAKAGSGTKELKGHEPKTVGRRVLVVDDNVDAAQTGARLLRLCGHDVEVAHNGPDAIDTASVFHPEFVLLDISMPGMDGYEVARRLRQRDELGAARLVALSGHGTEEDRKRAKDAGFDAHLIKPVDPDALAQLLAIK